MQTWKDISFTKPKGKAKENTYVENQNEAKLFINELIQDAI